MEKRGACFSADGFNDASSPCIKLVLWFCFVDEQNYRNTEKNLTSSFLSTSLSNQSKPAITFATSHNDPYAPILHGETYKRRERTTEREKFMHYDGSFPFSNIHFKNVWGAKRYIRMLAGSPKRGYYNRRVLWLKVIPVHNCKHTEVDVESLKKGQMGIVINFSGKH